MSHSQPPTAGLLRAAGAQFLAHLDRIHPSLLLPVCLLLTVTLGALAVAAAAVLAAGVVTAGSAGVVLCARRAIRAAAAYQPRPRHHRTEGGAA